MLLILIFAVFRCSSSSPPGKPVLKQCRSPDKETFTCKWEPAADDGEDTTYRLLYEKELTNGIFECPDYHTAGKNTCFFNKNYTSIWIDYFLTVVAINAFGNTTSDVYKIDVESIVMSDPPENLTLKLDKSQDSLTVNVTWNAFDVGSKTGWITPKYQLRFRTEDTKWKIQDAGIYTSFNLYSASPGKLYMVQVRCQLDNGAWSEWSNIEFIHVPHSEYRKQRISILVSFLAVPFFALVCILIIKRKMIKQWLLPPVPGPKIKGVNLKLLKNGQSEEVTRALHRNHVFPSGLPWTNQAEEYLVVCDDDNIKLLEYQNHINGMISNHFQLKPNVSNQLIVTNNGKSKEQVMLLDYCEDTSNLREKALSNHLINILNMTPTENSSYVDIQRQKVEIRPTDYSTVRKDILFLEKQNRIDKNKQEDRLPDDYTRVKEVNSDNLVLLQDSSSRHNAQYCHDQMPSHPVTGRVGGCAEFINGYVDNIPVTLSGYIQ